MAISRIASQDAKASSSAATVGATYPGATTAGNLLIATVQTNAGSDTVAISGWTKAISQFAAVANGTHGIFYKLADGTETTVTATGGATAARIHIYEYTGNANPIVLDGTPVKGTFASATSESGAAVTTTGAASLVFASICPGGSVSAPAATAPFSLRQVDASAIRVIDGDDITTSAGTYTPAFSWTTTQAGSRMTIAFQAPASASITAVPAFSRARTVPAALSAGASITAQAARDRALTRAATLTSTVAITVTSAASRAQAPSPTASASVAFSTATAITRSRASGPTFAIGLSVTAGTAFSRARGGIPRLSSAVSLTATSALTRTRGNPPAVSATATLIARTAFSRSTTTYPTASIPAASEPGFATASDRIVWTAVGQDTQLALALGRDWLLWTARASDQEV